MNISWIGDFFMIYVFNKNKILSYMVASFIVIGLFVFSVGTVPDNVEIVKVSSNVITNNIISNIKWHKSKTNCKNNL